MFADYITKLVCLTCKDKKKDKVGDGNGIYFPAVNVLPESDPRPLILIFGVGRNSSFVNLLFLCVKSSRRGANR